MCWTKQDGESARQCSAKPRMQEPVGRTPDLEYVISNLTCHVWEGSGQFVYIQSHVGVIYHLSYDISNRLMKYDAYVTIVTIWGWHIFL